MGNPRLELIEQRGQIPDGTNYSMCSGLQQFLAGGGRAATPFDVGKRLPLVKGKADLAPRLCDADAPGPGIAAFFDIGHRVADLEDGARGIDSGQLHQAEKHPRRGPAGTNVVRED